MFMPMSECLRENQFSFIPSKMWGDRKNILKAYFITALLMLTALSEVFGQQQQLQRQHFRATPKDQHVIEGQTSLIECEVGNQRGRVQWAKDGFVLGFNRSIPGYPRYEMVGDGEDGSHHLRIHNTTLVDDAAYQCQVGPADGHPPIRATGRLTVLLPPSVVRLEGGGREDVIEVNEGDEITLECQVLNSKPVAKVQWFKNDQEIKFDNNKDEIKESSLERRFDVISKITVKLTSLDDDSHYVCQAEHQALDRPVKASIRISVLYPPGPPVITGYTEGENIRAGEERILTCKSKGGNPLGQVVWYRNNVEKNDTNNQAVRGESVNEYPLTVQAKDNGAVFMCEVSNKLTKKPFRSSVTLSVLFPPEKVLVTGPAQARVGENVTLTCFVENTNPPSAVSWVADGKPNNLLAHTRNERAGGGGWHSVSTLTYHVPPVDRNIMFACHATNEALGKTSVDTFLLSVLRPPQPPEIYGYSESIGVRVGQEQSLSCVSRGGNPPAQLQWYRNGAKIPSEKHSVEEVSTAKITIQAEPHDNGAQFRCDANNAAESTPVSVSTALVVFFPPQKVKLNVHPEHLHAGNQATLTCEAGPSNPPVEISWLRGGFKMNGHMQETKDTPNKGFIVTNVLVLNLTAADNDLMYTCQAMNTALQQKLQKSATLHVRYSPQFLEPPPEVVDVKIGDSLVLNLTAKGNPDPVTYSWKHRGIPLPKAVMEEKRIRDFDATSSRSRPRGISGPRVSSEGSILRVQNVTIDDSGDYELEARNSQGSTFAKIYLNVRYAVVIRETSGSVSVSQGEDAVLECSAEGNPLSESMMKWHRANYHFSKTEQTFGRKKATLKVLSATRNDTGVFTCIADNGIGASVSANISLIVNAKPIVSKSKLLGQAAARLGSTGRLRCEADGAPEVHFAWRKNGIWIPKNSFDAKYRNETFKIGLVTWASTLEIREVRERDFGYYDCVASNLLGSSTWSIQFTAPTKPKPPVSLKIVNSSHDSVTLEWTPGFDGGATQYFRLRYRPKMSHSSYEYVDIYEPNVNAYTVTGLQLDTEYYFSIMSKNEFGDSDYRAEFVRALTLSEAPPTPVPSSNVGREVYNAPLPALWVVIIVLVALALLALNVSAIVCILRRKRRKRGGGAGKKLITQNQGHKGVLHSGPSIPLSGVTSHPTFGSDLASSKSTTNTMYAPSSYNDTVVGETLSSISEKSRESSYNQEDSVGDYEDQSHHKDTYVINQIEPPPEYASQTPSTQPSSAAFDPNEDDYAEVLRRNAYNHQLGKGTPRLPSRATHYSTSPDSRGYISYSYTPSPTGLPNGGQYLHHHHHLELMPSVVNYGGMQIMEDPEHTLHSVLKNLDLDPNPPPPLDLEQHSIPSEHPSLTLDPHSITIDHPLSGEPPRNGDLRVQSTSLSTFNPNPSPSSYSESEMEGHLV